MLGIRAIGNLAINVLADLLVLVQKVGLAPRPRRLLGCGTVLRDEDREQASPCKDT